MQEDYADFEADATNVNQIPQARAGAAADRARPRRASRSRRTPQMFPQGSPHLSHMGQPPQQPRR